MLEARAPRAATERPLAPAWQIRLVRFRACSLAEAFASFKARTRAQNIHSIPALGDGYSRPSKFRRLVIWTVSTKNTRKRASHERKATGNRLLG